MYEGSENPFLAIQIIGQKYRTKCSGTSSTHPPHRCKIWGFVVLSFSSVFLVGLAAVFLDTEVNFFLFLVHSVTFQSTKIIEK